MLYVFQGITLFLMTPRGTTGTALPCPECREQNPESPHLMAIGNRKTRCQTCNNFNQNVLRMARARLQAKYPEEFKLLKLEVKLDLYPQVIEDYAISRGLQ